MKYEIQQLKSYTSPEVEKLIETINLEIQDTSIKKGKFFAGKNLPAPTGDILSNYTNESKAVCEKTESDVAKILQIETHLTDGAILKQQAEDEQNKLQEEDASITNQIKNDEYELNGVDPYYWDKQKKLAVIFLSAIFLSEMYFNGNALQVIGDSFIVGLVISFGLSAGVLYGTHSSAKIFKSQNSLKAKITNLIITFTAASIVFVALAFLRSSYSKANGNEIGPWIYYVINLVLGVVAWFISYFKFPDPNKLDMNEKLKRLAENIKSHKQRKEQIKQTIATIKDELTAKLSLRIAVINYFKLVQKTLSKSYAMGVENFKASNLMNRHTPTDCFSQQVPPLNFRRDFEDDEPANPQLS